MRPFLGVGLYGLSMIFACAEAYAGSAPPDDSPIIARIGDRPISLADLDRAGGRAVYDASRQLYEARVRILYQLLSAEVLQREAAAQGLTQAQLIDQAVLSSLPALSDAEIDTFLSAQASTVAQDAKRRPQAQLYLGMKRQADAKREFVARLFDKHQVHIALPRPSAPPAEEVRGPEAPVLGKVTAPVKVIVFSDYQCRYCRELSHAVDALLSRFPDDVQVIYRHYPLREASERWSHAALCAADQHQFARYHARLFASPLEAADPTQFAISLGLDVNAFNTCMAEQRHQARIAADKTEAQRLGIEGTPTLFVAGQRYRGVQTLEQLIDVVKQGLASDAAATAH